jgi:hypothetical protein
MTEFAADTDLTLLASEEAMRLDLSAGDPKAAEYQNYIRAAISNVARQTGFGRAEHERLLMIG